MQMRSTASREPILSTFSQILRFGSLTFDFEVAGAGAVCAIAGDTAVMASAAMISGFSIFRNSLLGRPLSNALSNPAGFRAISIIARWDRQVLGLIGFVAGRRRRMQRSGARR